MTKVLHVKVPGVSQSGLQVDISPLNLVVDKSFICGFGAVQSKGSGNASAAVVQPSVDVVKKS